ncbi:MAG: gliding motility-associated C-terminal domain-containing protein [Flavobacteriales bacterium]|nr:gliding motility-associated C-terminal domain-containing protein [Flavobacteriales bacterium]
MRTFYSIRNLLILFVSFGFAIDAFAGRNEGMNVQYECLGGDEYLITAHLFRDCAQDVFGIGQIPIPAFVTSSCESIGYIPLVLADSLEVSQLCPDSLPFSSCNGGNLPGVYLYVYEATATMPPCYDWEIIIAETNRADVLNLNDPLGDSSRHLVTSLNNSTGECNSSPQLGLLTLPFVCVEDVFFYNLSFTDPDGDSLVYALTPALKSTQPDTPQNMDYVAGYSSTSPLNILEFNSSTGQMNITPDLEGKYTVVVEVKEYRNEMLIGSVYFDFNVIVIPCAVAPPVPIPGTLSQISGGGYPMTDSQIGICQGDDFCLQLDFSSIDPALELTLEADIAEGIPGATYTQIGSNPATIELCGTLPLDFTSGDFVVSARDNFCPIFGQAFYAIEFVIRDPLLARPDTTICAGESVQLNAQNDVSYTWFDTEGNQVPVSTIFSCNPCQSPIATVDTTTSFVVQGEFTDGICASTDTVTINVPLGTEINVVPETCLEDDGIIEISIITGSGDYTVEWDDDPTNDLIRGNLDAGSYSVSILDNAFNCQFSETFVVDNLVFPLADAGENDFVCGIEYQLSATPSFGISQWTSNHPEISIDNANLPTAIVTASSPGVYSLVWTEDDDQGSGNGCIDSDTLTLEFFELPEAVISSLDSVCGFEVDIAIQASSSSNTWETTSNVLITQSQQDFAQATVLEQGLGEVIFFSFNGPCSASDTLVVQFIEQPIANAGNDEILCGNEVELSANPSIGQGAWQLPEGVNASGSLNESNLTVLNDQFGFFDIIWTEENLGYCSDRDTIEVGFVQQPTIEPLLDTMVCGNDLVLTAIALGQTITWEGDQGLSLSSFNSLTTNVSADYGSYNLSLIADNGFGCIASEQVQLTFLEQPELAPELLETICGFDTELVAPETDFQIDWQSADLELTSENGESTSVSTSFEGDFVVMLIVNNQELCYDTTNYQLTFYEQPLTVAPEDTSVCGLSVFLEADATSGNLQWSTVGVGDFSDFNAASTSFTSDTYDQFNLTITETNGPCSSMDSLTVDFQPIPQILNPEFICTGVDATFQFTFEASGDFGSGYLILGLEGDLDGDLFTSFPLESGLEIDFSLSNYSVCENATFQGSHGCPIISSSGAMTSDTIKVCGDQNAIADQLSPPDLDGNDVLRYILHDSETSAVGNIFSWSEVPVFSFEEPLLWNEVYYISPVVGNPNGQEVDLSNPQVSVGEGQPVIFIPDPTAILNYDETICPNEEAIVEVEFSGNFPQLFTYSFNGVQTSVEVDSLFIELIFSDSGSVIPVSISSQNCVGQIIGSAEISYHPEPSLAVDWEGEFCEGDSATVMLNLQGESPFVFSFGETSSIQTYQVLGDTLFIINSGGDYVISSIADQICSIDEEVAFSIEQLPLPAVEAGVDITICNEDTVLIGTSAQPGLSYSWNGSQSVLTPSSATSIYVGENTGSSSDLDELILVADNGSCANQDTLQIEVFPKPNLQISASEKMCRGDSLFVVGFGADQLNWQPMTLFSNPDSSQSTYYSEVSSFITLSGTNEAGCMAQVSQEVQILDPPNVEFLVSEKVGCEPMVVDLQMISPASGVAYSWLLNGENIEESSYHTQLQLDRGAYEVSLKGISEEGCLGISATPILIEVFSVEASFDYFPENPSISDPEVNFYSTSENDQLLIWQFDSLDTSQDEFLTFNFPTEFGSDYLVCLDVISSEGCLDSICEVITIADDFYIYVPSAFTPDGDGINDLFFPQLSKVDVVEYHFWITNRYGVTVFETRDPSAKWDGSEKDSNFFGKADLYQWHLEAKPEFNLEERFYTGTVMMIR